MIYFLFRRALQLHIEPAMSKIAADWSTDNPSLELQSPPRHRKQNIFVRIYSRPFKELSVWEIVLRVFIALLIGAVVGVIIGVIIRFA